MFRSFLLTLAALALLTAPPVQAATIIDSYGYAAPDEGGGGAVGLASVVDNVVWEIVAGDTDSYPGSGQRVYSLTTSPACGDDQEDYDWSFGVNSAGGADDPGFSTNKFTFDGGDRMTLWFGNTPCMSNLHKTTGGGDHTFIFVARIGAISGTNTLFSTSSGTTSHGLNVIVNSSGRLAILQRGAAISQNSNSSNILSAGTDYILIVTHSHSLNNTRIFAGTTTGGSVSHTYSTSTTDASLSGTIGWGPYGNVTNGTWIYAAAMLNTYLSDNTESATIADYYETLLGIDLTP